MRKRLLVIGGICTAALLAVLGISLTGLFGIGKKTVGRQVKKADVTEFYWTRASSAFPPDYQRYHFSVKNGEYQFYHETREGEHFPLRESDITDSGTKLLSAEEWDRFYTLVEGGTVAPRREDAGAGDDGPWTYLYWKKDGGKVQEYSFPSYEAGRAFEAFCQELKNEMKNP